MQDPSYVRNAFQRIASRYDLTNRVLSGGIDLIWRRRVVELVVAQRPRKVLDLAAGTGDLALALQRRLPQAQVIAADLTEEMLDIARRRGVLDTRVADAMALPFADGEFDALTCAFGLRNMADYLGALKEMRRVLRPGGLLVVLDFSTPPPPLTKPYKIYLEKIVPRIAGAVTGSRDAYEYLAGSIETFPSGRDLLALFHQAGFEATGSWPFTAAIATLYTGRAG